HMELLAVEALAVAEQTVLTQMLAMVGGDDDQCVVKPGAPFKLVKKFADFGIDVCDAVVVRIGGQTGESLRHVLFWAIVPVMEQGGVGGVLHARPEPRLGTRGQEIRSVGVEEIQEGEEGAPSILFGEPVDKIMTDRRGILATPLDTQRKARDAEQAPAERRAA